MRGPVYVRSVVAPVVLVLLAQVIAAKEAGSAAPVRSIEGNSFLYIRHKDMFFVAVTRGNANACELLCSRRPTGMQMFRVCTHS